MITIARYLRVRLFITAAILWSAACGSGERSIPDGAAAEAVRGPAGAAADGGAAETATLTGPGYKVVNVSNGGTIKGVVRLGGSVPPERVVEVDEDADVCGARREVQPVNIGPSDGLADVVASLTDIQEGAGFAGFDGTPQIDQSECRFVPHVVLLPISKPLAILNSDPVTHNIHTFAFDNRPVNRAQPSAVKKIETSFSVPEKVKLNCDMHEWMGAWIVVMGHPYHAKTDRDGGFTIDDVPPGSYTLEIWHEALGTQTAQVTVSAGETTRVSFEMSNQT